jgi:hypothetical protein
MKERMKKGRSFLRISLSIPILLMSVFPGFTSVNHPVTPVSCLDTRVMGQGWDFPLTPLKTERESSHDSKESENKEKL